MNINKLLAFSSLAVSTLALSAALQGCGSYRYATEYYDVCTGKTHRFDAPSREPSDLDIRRLWSKKIDGYVFEFRTEPIAPVVGKETILVLSIVTMKDGREVPVTKASVKGVQHLPDDKENVQFPDSGANALEYCDGVYHVPATFSKEGIWEVDFTAGSIGGREYSLRFPLRLGKPQ